MLNLEPTKDVPLKKSFLENHSQEEVDWIFSLESKMRTNIVIPSSEATHSSLDLFEKPPLLVTFDQSFEQKTGPLYSPSGSSLEFEVVGDRNNFIDLQKTYLEVKCRIQNADGTDLRYTPAMQPQPMLHILSTMFFIHCSPTVLFLQME